MDWSQVLGPAVAVIVAFILGFVFGEKWSTLWNLKQARKERELKAAETFYELYGKFFGIWKQWSGLFKPKLYSADQGGKQWKAEQWKTYERACSLEGELEALLVRLAAEKRLKPEDMAVLGRFRKACQRVRERIQTQEPLKWNFSQHPEYLALKWLSCRVAGLLATRDLREAPPDPAQSCASLEVITHNTWEQSAGAWEEPGIDLVGWYGDEKIGRVETEVVKRLEKAKARPPTRICADTGDDATTQVPEY